MGIENSSDYKAFEIYEPLGADAAPILILCDHATNALPPNVSTPRLGLSLDDFARHIAYDIGAAGLSKQLAERLGAKLVTSGFSRLYIDPNRGEEDPTLIMQLYDGAIIEGNRDLTPTEVEARLKECYRPYHDAIDALRRSFATPPVLISIHSFTPQLRGREMRPWDIGVLSNQDRRLAEPLLAYFRAETAFSIGDNEPYNGALKNDTMDRHAVSHGLRHVLIEVRNDLIQDQVGQARWAEILAKGLRNLLDMEHK